MQSESRRPIAPLAKTGLLVSTAAIVFLFYVFALVTALLLILLLAVEFVLILALLRFGLSGILAPVMGAHIRIVGIIFRSLWLPAERAIYRIPLQPPEAPGLFQILQTLAQRFGVQPPNEVQLEMSVNAWVRLKGIRSGSGDTLLGFGYDLLAGLTVSEIEAVFAHELAHAKLVQRGFSRFAHASLHRCARLVGALAYNVQEGRSLRDDRAVARMLHAVGDKIIQTLARLIAAYSRQDEFEADHGAAEVCGSGPLRSALQKLGPLNEASSRIQWRERVAQLQTGRGYTNWFSQQITSHLASATADSEAEVFDKFSTHPALVDRLAALPPPTDAPATNDSAISLLANPDATAEKLIAEIHRVAAIEEERDTKALQKWNRGRSTRTSLTGLQTLGVFIVLPAFIALIFAAVDRSYSLFFGSLVAMAIGVLLVWKAGYRDRRQLPVPDFTTLTQANDKKIQYDQEDAIEKELASLASAEKKKKRKADILLGQAYDALGRCDYLRAHVASRLCYKVIPKSIEVHLAFAVAAAGIHAHDDAAIFLQVVQHHTGFRTPSTAWGAAWACSLIGNWTFAEALFQTLSSKNPDNKTFLTLLALARARRGKSSSAIVAARQVCTPSPPTLDHARLLINILLDAGMLREASSRLSALQDAAKTDSEIQLQMVRLSLLTHDYESADRWSVTLLSAEALPRRKLQLAWLYQQARRFDRAEEYFNDVRDKGYYSEALLGLGQIEAERKNKLRAREHLLAALNPKIELARDAAGPIPLFGMIAATVSSLEEPAHCLAWEATLPTNGRLNPALANTVFHVFAPDQLSAQIYAHTLVAAFEPAVQPSDFYWQKAPKDEQPVRPVRPGVQNVTRR